MNTHRCGPLWNRLHPRSGDRVAGNSNGRSGATHGPQAQRHGRKALHRAPLDLLRIHHERIEAWILEQAGVQLTSTSEPGKLRVVAGGAGPAP